MAASGMTVRKISSALPCPLPTAQELDRLAEELRQEVGRFR